MKHNFSTFSAFARQAGQHTGKIFLLFALICSVSPILISAQNKRLPVRSRAAVAKANNRQTRRIPPRTTGANVVAANTDGQNKTAVTTVSTTTALPVTIINRPSSDYLTGEASVSVNPNQPTVIRLGLAQNAVSVVEFPAIDRIYYIHEGNPKLVTIFQSPTKETDRSITLYPGESFMPAPIGQKPLSVTVTMQMKSGLVIVLEIVPAPDISQNAHRCVLNYNFTEIIAARRAAGLKVNLGDGSAMAEENQLAPPVRTTRASSRLMTAATASEVATASETAIAEATDDNSVTNGVSVEISDSDVARKTENRRNREKVRTGENFTRFVNKRLAEAIKKPRAKFLTWTPNFHGLSLSTARIAEVDDKQRLLLVAVKNETTEVLRLLSELPELQMQTIDEKGNVLQIERLERKHVETTALMGAIPAGATCYYAIVFDAPVMGAKQKLLVSVAHSTAADAPAQTNVLNQLGEEKK